MAMPMEQHCSDRTAAWCYRASRLCGTPQGFYSLLYGTPDIHTLVSQSKWYFHPTQPQGLLAVTPKNGYSGVFIPG